MTPERPRWLDRWLQTDDDELLYADQTIVTTSEDETLDALEHARLTQAERRTEEARLREEWERWAEEWEAWAAEWVDTQEEDGHAATFDD